MTTKSVAFASIKDLKLMLEKKEMSAQELLQCCVDRFKKYDEDLGSALEIFDVQSVGAGSSAQGPLAGIPGLIKDVIVQKGRETTCASKILKGYIGTYDATAVKRLKEAGALCMGRANCDEFAMGSSNEYSAYKVVKNPWDASRVAGGSSGGSVAAVAAGLVPFSLGTETGGSIRTPAVFCGIVGSKPTYGLVSRYGLVAYGSSLDQIGVATRTVYDNALVLSLIAGNDAHDSSSVKEQKFDFTQNLTGKIKPGLTIGVLDDALYAEGMDPEVVSSIELAIKQLEQLGATVKHMKLPVLQYGMAAYIIISRAEAASNLSKFDGVRYGARDARAQTLAEMYTKTRRKGFGEIVRRRIMVGNYVLSAGHADDFYGNAQKVRYLIREGFLSLFKDVDVLVMPVAPMPAFKLGGITNPLQMDLVDYFTCPINLAGIPAVSVPCGFTKQNLPIGLQFVGSHYSEGLLFQTAHAYEKATAWHTMHPAAFKE